MAAEEIGAWKSCGEQPNKPDRHAWKAAETGLVSEKEFDCWIVEVSLMLSVETCNRYYHRPCRNQEYCNDNRQQRRVNYKQCPGQD